MEMNYFPHIYFLNAVSVFAAAPVITLIPACLILRLMKKRDILKTVWRSYLLYAEVSALISIFIFFVYYEPVSNLCGIYQTIFGRPISSIEEFVVFSLIHVPCFLFLFLFSLTKNKYIKWGWILPFICYSNFWGFLLYVSRLG